MVSWWSFNKEGMYKKKDYLKQVSKFNKKNEKSTSKEAIIAFLGGI